MFEIRPSSIIGELGRTLMDMESLFEGYESVFGEVFYGTGAYYRVP